MSLSVIKQIENYASLFLGTISLAQGVPSLPTNSVIKNNVIKAIKNGLVDHYSLSAGLPELRKLILGKHKLGNKYDAIVTVGAIEAVSALLLTYCNPGDEVLAFSPLYSSYKSMADVARVNIVLSSLNKDNWRPDLADFKKKITKKTKVILLCNPNNPTGTVFTKKEIDFIITEANKKNIIVIFDEVYRNFYFDNRKHISGTSYIKKYKNCVTVLSLSKDFSFSGWRAGFILAHQELLTQVYATHDALVNCAPVVSQYAAIAALKHEEKIIKTNINFYKQNRDLMGGMLEKLGDKVSFIYPDGGYYFFVKINGVKDTTDMCFDMVRKARVALVPGSSFDPSCGSYIRICFGRSKQDIKIGIQRFEKYLQGN